MDLRIERRARKHILASGGLLTLEAQGDVGCLVTRDIVARAAKPEDPGQYREAEVGDVRVFTRGVLRGGDGSEHPSHGIFPKRMKVALRDGALVVD